jgi:branched-chain amino acid transport system substrate-binding protein
MKRKISKLLTICLAFGMLTSCNTVKTTKSESDSDVIKIGVFEPLTGAYAAGGELEIEGIKIANDLYPEVLGKKVELVIVDNKSDKAESSAAVARLIEKERVVSLIGSYSSSLAISGGNIAKDKKIPVVVASATNPQVTLNNDYSFRICFIDSFQGTVMANYAHTNLGYENAAIIREISNDYSVGLASFFEDSFIKLTGKEDSIVEVSNYTTGDTDFSSILTNIKAKNPQVIFLPGNFTESALVIKQARQLGIDIPFLGGDTWEIEEFVTTGGKDVEGAAFATFFAKEAVMTDVAEKFLLEYEKRNPGKEASAVTALAFDAYITILNAIEVADSTDPEKIREALAKTTDFEGVAGIITLDENGDAIKNAVIKHVENGKFKYLDIVEVE